MCPLEVIHVGSTLIISIVMLVIIYWAEGALALRARDGGFKTLLLPANSPHTPNPFSY